MHKVLDPVFPFHRAHLIRFDQSKMELRWKWRANGKRPWNSLISKSKRALTFPIESEKEAK